MQLPKFCDRLSELILDDSDNITIAKFGEKIGFRGSTVSLWKTGKRVPSLQNIICLAEYFNCSIDFLLGRIDNDIQVKRIKNLPLFHEHLLSILNARSLSWYKVVQDTSVSKSSLKSWRYGSTPLLPTLIELANYLKVSVDYLVGRDDQP
ncbi:MAG: helix-turn-helix domain-containing protein [Firmicutes bacterium]|nr:helix-turn-helix domain-containing protein [Bacillota bacterium]